MSTLWGSNFSTRLILSLLMGMIKCFQITQSNKFAISLLYLKKEDRNGDNFWHADKRQSFYKPVLSFLMEVARHVQNTKNRKLVIFFQYFRENVATTVFYCDAKHSDILQRSSHVRCYLFLTNWRHKHHRYTIKISSIHLNYLYRFYQTDTSRND